MDKDIVHQELNMIQNCITRMADNSFQLRKWYMSMVFIGGGKVRTKTLTLCHECALRYRYYDKWVPRI